MNLQQFAMKMIENNPQVKNNPRMKDMVDVIMSGDQKRGEEIAMNLCNTYGCSREDAINKATNYFNLR